MVAVFGSSAKTKSIKTQFLLKVLELKQQTMYAFKI
jgi:hypothetical protein